jgi:hypothetical protein
MRRALPVQNAVPVPTRKPRQIDTDRSGTIEQFLTRYRRQVGAAMANLSIVCKDYFVPNQCGFLTNLSIEVVDLLANRDGR